MISIVCGSGIIPFAVTLPINNVTANAENSNAETKAAVQVRFFTGYPCLTKFFCCKKRFCQGFLTKPAYAENWGGRVCIGAETA